MIYRDNVQVPPQPMPEISETHLYYTKVLLPPLTYFINNFLPLFSLRGTILWAQRWLTFFFELVPGRLKRGRKLHIK